MRWSAKSGRAPGRVENDEVGLEKEEWAREKFEGPGGGPEKGSMAEMEGSRWRPMGMKEGALWRE